MQSLRICGLYIYMLGTLTDAETVAVTLFRYDGAVVSVRTRSGYDSSASRQNGRRSRVLNRIAVWRTSSAAQRRHYNTSTATAAIAIIARTSATAAAAIVRIVYGTLHICGGRRNILDGGSCLQKRIYQLMCV